MSRWFAELLQSFKTSATRGGFSTTMPSFGGIKWFSDQIAQPIQEAITTEDLRSAALSVPGVLTVESVQLKALDTTTRVLSAEVQVTTEGGSYGTARI